MPRGGKEDTEGDTDLNVDREKLENEDEILGAVYMEKSSENERDIKDIVSDDKILGEWTEDVGNIVGVANIVWVSEGVVKEVDKERELRGTANIVADKGDGLSEVKNEEIIIEDWERQQSVVWVVWVLWVLVKVRSRLSWLGVESVPAVLAKERVNLRDEDNREWDKIVEETGESDKGGGDFCNSDSELILNINEEN